MSVKTKASFGSSPVTPEFVNILSCHTPRSFVCTKPVAVTKRALDVALLARKLALGTPTAEFAITSESNRDRLCRRFLKKEKYGKGTNDYCPDEDNPTAWFTQPAVHVHCLV